MHPSASKNYAGWRDAATPESGRRIRHRRTPGTPPCRPVLRGSSSRVDLGLIAAEPESCSDQERVFRSSVARITVSQTLNVIVRHQLTAQFFLVRRRLVGHIEDLIA